MLFSKTFTFDIIFIVFAPPNDIGYFKIFDAFI